MNAHVFASASERYPHTTTRVIIASTRSIVSVMLSRKIRLTDV